MTYYFLLLDIHIDSQKLEKDDFKTPKVVNGKSRIIFKEKLRIVKNGERGVGRWIAVDSYEHSGRLLINSIEHNMGKKSEVTT